MKILNKQFYTQSTTEIAKQLLGKFLCRKINGKIYIGKIVETEAYLGKKDLACHTSKGKTKRNEVMFGSAGHAYIYFIYGMYHCFNVVTEEENNPCAVLVRALEPINIPRRRNTRFCIPTTNGPAKLCREFQVDKKLNGHNLTLGEKLWIENGDTIKPNQIKRSKRVGVDYAGIWKDRLLRFYIKDNEFVSKR
ncbi:MAG: DNA-3-methyladenine glycosylase [Candidatus Pacebacteria bacterium]|nr:DNA-3-methyladenine glycosylase [Candidatus Paceibacterota bacterium]